MSLPTLLCSYPRSLPQRQQPLFTLLGVLLIHRPCSHSFLLGQIIYFSYSTTYTPPNVLIQFLVKSVVSASITRNIKYHALLSHVVYLDCIYLFFKYRPLIVNAVIAFFPICFVFYVPMANIFQISQQTCQTYGSNFLRCLEYHIICQFQIPFPTTWRPSSFNYLLLSICSVCFLN